MATLIWFIIGIYLEFKKVDIDSPNHTDSSEWGIVIMPALIIDAIGVAVTCLLFPSLSLCGCN